MRIIDRKAKQNLGRYVSQCALATLVILIIFLFFDLLLGASLVASLGATTFIVFALPTSRPAQPRRLLGGYAIATLCGVLCSLLASSPLVGFTGLSQNRIVVIFSAVAVGIAIFTMALTNTEHPPAAGLALGFVADYWDWRTILFVLGAAALLTLTKRLLRNTLLDLF